VSKRREWKRVQPRIESLVKEAIAILKEYKFPTSSTQLMKFKKEPPDRLALEATLVVHAGYYLYQAIKNNKADKSALRMFDLLSAYLEMADLRDVPESAEWMKIGPVDNEVDIKARRAGYKNILRNKNKDNAISLETVNEIKARAIQLRNENPDLLIYQIINILVKEFNVSPSFIEKMKPVPKKHPKKKK